MAHTNRKRGWIVSLAATAALAMAGLASAQQRIESSGRALDASNRVGSGGYNSGREFQNLSPSGNNIVYGNVTGGREFRGNTASTDPLAFRGNLAGAGVDRFVRNSAGVTPAGFQSNAQTARTYYGDSRGVAPPPGFAPIGQTGGYVPAPPPQRIGSDLRLGELFETPQINLPRPGELLLPGPVDASNNSLLISASPLYGVKALNSGDASDVNFATRYTDLTGRRGADEATINRLRRELTDASGDDADADAQDGETGDSLNNQARPGDGSQPLQPGNNLNQPLNNGAINSTITNGPLSQNLNSGQVVRNQVVMTPSLRTDAQYRELATRLENFRRGAGIEDANLTASREYNAAVRRTREMEAAAAQPTTPQQDPNAAAGGNAPGGAPGERPSMPGGQTPDMTGQPGQPGGIAGQPGGLVDPNMPGARTGPGRTITRTKPPVVSSLAEGVPAKGLKDVMAEAEKLMQEQKFISALQRYDIAEQAEPNNPKVILGRANAELGASYYGRAETHLRQAFTSAPALLMAQYDLRKFLGEERLTFLVKDLKEIANTEKDSSRPLLLLAYIAYNEGNDRMAAGYIDLAEKRSGGGDPFYRMLREHWQLPSVGAEESDFNK